MVDEQQLAHALAATSPALRVLSHRVEEAHRAVDLARTAGYPELVVGADYTFVGSRAGVAGSGDDALAVTLGLSLPVWRSTYRAEARGADARLHRAREEQQEAFNRLSSELEMSLYELRDAGRRVVLFRDSLVPKGEESVQALDTAYQSGDEGFLDLIDAQRVLLEFQLEAARAETDRAKALAVTERITGVALNTES